MDSIMGGTWQDEENQGSHGMVLNTNRIPDQMNNQYQSAVSAASSLGTFSLTGLEIPQQSFIFDFNNHTFGDLMTLPSSMDIDIFENNPFPLIPNPEFSVPLVLNHIHSCPQGHNHAPWPRTGLLEIQKCERRCHFCGQELKTAAALRKHAYDHKKKDKFEIEITPGSSGRQRRALLLDNNPSVLEHLSAAVQSPTQVRDGQITSGIQDSFPDVFESLRIDLGEATTLVRKLRRENAELKEENKALKAEIHRLTREEKNKEAQRKFRENLKRRIDGNRDTGPEARESPVLSAGFEDMDEFSSLPWGGLGC
ncbi:hypothetical protein E0Z10_g4774 [Xylaria hypoxylon]|uniref:C2H2-type domain-containing protein n=1 Tax=Xylaria hypoxylon TaxID=37992 RepID=A0A4Z0YKA9_9PEZI|nr:hypothetical protein E0Z10_g4774 [Xylaria hypoxylon]